jgi:hypothetical protein
MCRFLSATNASSFLSLLLTLVLSLPNFAHAQQQSVASAHELGSVLVFQRFVRGTQTLDNVRTPTTEIEIRVQCPNGTTCADNEPVKIRFHWVCPGNDDIASKGICKEAGFDIIALLNSKVSFNPEDSSTETKNPAISAPCPSGYLIGWVVDANTNRPIKFDALSGNAIIRETGGAIGRYKAITIQAEANLPSRTQITTDIDPRTGTPSLVFDGGAGHYQSLGAQIPQALEYHKLPGQLSSSEAFLVLLTLDVRLDRPNYPTFVDLNFQSDEGVRASRSMHFTCWTEIRSPNINAAFTLVGARDHDHIILSGWAAKVPFGGISDIPGPVTLLGLAPGEERDGTQSIDPVYIAKNSESTKAMSVFVPFD